MNITKYTNEQVNTLKIRTTDNFTEEQDKLQLFLA
jgi:hypothetical protein